MTEGKNIPNNQIVPQEATQSLMQDLRQIIEQTRVQVATTANYALTTMYWHIGERINRDVLGNQRAEYGKQIVATVVRQLQAEYGAKGFEERTIRRMMKFAQTFPDFQILSTLLSKLSWSHFLIVMTILDLLFYHRRLHRLIAIDLKLGKFKAQYKGQMELYLRWLEKHEMEPGEESPLGLLLCTEGGNEQIELLQLDKSGIKVAQYMTELPPKELLQKQLQKSLAEAKARIDNQTEE